MTYAVLVTTGADLDADGRYDIQLEGTVGDIKRRAKPCGGATAMPAEPSPVPAFHVNIAVAELPQQIATRLRAGIYRTGPTTFDVNHELVDLVGTNIMDYSVRVMGQPARVDRGYSLSTPFARARCTTASGCRTATGSKPSMANQS